VATKRGEKPAPKQRAKAAKRPSAKRPSAGSGAKTTLRAVEADGSARGSIAARVKAAIAELERRSSKQVKDGMARYAIPSDHAFGVPVGVIRQLGKKLGVDHELALALYTQKPYEARMLAVFVADPERLTAAEMDSWCRAFDNWAICDTACFHLFDRSPYAFAKVNAWAKKKPEFEKRAAFALLASLALHHRSATDAEFERCLPLIEREANDSRNFVKKAVNWALRGVGGRSVALHGAALDVSKRLAALSDPTPRWIGKDALRELEKPALVKRAATRDAARASRVARSARPSPR
jgi:3-methyladenine DNA glycosylase AlkD